MKFVLYVLLLAALWLNSCNGSNSSQANLTSSSTVVDEKQALLTVLNSWKDAYLHPDTAAIAALLADEWSYSGSSTGKIVTKAESIASFAKSTGKYESIEFEELDVKVYDHTGIITGRETMRVRSGDTVNTYKLRFTDVYVKKGNKWLAVATHTSPITD